MMTSLFETLGRNKAMLELVAQKNSPKMLFIGGVAGMVGSTVLACRATLKVEQVLHETQRDIQITKHIRHQHEDQYRGARHEQRYPIAQDDRLLAGEEPVESDGV